MFAKKKTKLARTSRQKRKHLLGRSMKNANQTLAASIKKGGGGKRESRKPSELRVSVVYLGDAIKPS